jgi:hypothetical protein
MVGDMLERGHLPTAGRLESGALPCVGAFVRRGSLPLAGVTVLLIIGLVV